MDEPVNTTGQLTPEQAEQLCEQFVAEVEGTMSADLHLERTPEGFVLKYRVPLEHGVHGRRFATGFESRVSLSPATRTLTVLDVRDDHDADPRQGSTSSSQFRGKAKGRSLTRTYSRGADGSTEAVSSQSIDWDELHSPITAAAATLGWTEKAPAVAKGALWFGIATIGALVVGGIVVGVLALTGNLG